MNKKTYTTLLLFLLSLFMMLGCQQADPTEPSNNDTEQNEQSPDQQEDTDPIEDEQPTEDPADDSDAPARPEIQVIEYENEGVTEQVEAQLYSSDHQPFSMYVADTFEPSPEEPGKDIILYKINGDLSLRIEMQNQSDISLDTMIEETKTIAEDNVGPVTTEQVDLAVQGQTSETTMIFAASDHEKVYYYLMTTGDHTLRFTIHLPREAENLGVFNAMIETFQSQS